MSLRQRNFIATLTAAAILGLLVLPSPGAAQPCASGTDVRNLNDSVVPQSIKNQVLGSPGPIISITSSLFPSGKLVIIRTALQDAPVNTAVSAAYINEIFFGTVQGEKNIKGYFTTNSYGNFTVSSGALPGWITLAKKTTDYTPGIEGNVTFVQDVLKKASVNWSALDTNSDGIISVKEAQIVILIPNAMPGTGFASVRIVNPGTVATPTGSFTFSNRRFVYFSLKATADPQWATNPIRALPAVAHELGHAFFALPDRYGANTGTGEYDMMGSGSSSTWVHYTMHDKIKIGWIKPKFVQGHLGQCLQFVPSELAPAALVVVPIDQLQNSPMEYWIVENRNKIYDDEGYDDDLPGRGLAIWYNSVGTFFGHDDVRLVDFSKPDQDPDLYNNPWVNALFTLNPADPTRILLDRDGQWNLLWFQNVSDVNANYSGLFMYAEF